MLAGGAPFLVITVFLATTEQAIFLLITVYFIFCIVFSAATVQFPNLGSIKHFYSNLFCLKGICVDAF